MSAILNKWNREEKMTKEQIVKFQVLIYCHLADIRITRGELDYLTLLGLEGKSDLRDFCNKMVERKWFTTSASARNTVSSLLERKLIGKDGKNRKSVYIAPEMSIQSTDNILLDIKCFYRDI